MTENNFPKPLMNQMFPWSKELVETLEPYADLRSYRKGIRLALQENEQPVCRLIISGSVEVHRQSDDLLIVRAPAPGIVGLAIYDAYIITAESCRIATLPLEEVHRLVNEKGLWEILAQHMMIISSKLYAYSKQLSAPTAYETIRNHLIVLIHEPETLRENISVERYIRDKTHLSRSSIMKILSDLRSGGYIEIDEGRLKKIHHLPSKY